MQNHKTKEIAIACAGIIVIFVVFGVWINIAYAPVVYSAPPRPALPNPNAYDTYIRAANSLVFTDKIGEANRYNLAEDKAIIKANTRALSIFREGLKQEFSMPILNASSFPSYGQLRGLARAVSLQAVVYKESGENYESIMASLDGLKMGIDTAKGGNLIAGLVSVAIQAIARKDTWTTIDLLNPQETHKAIKRLDEIISQTVSYKSIMQLEMYNSLSDFEELLNSKDWRNQLSHPYMLAGSGATFKEYMNYALEYTKTLGMTKRGLFSGLYNDYSELIAVADLPYPDCIKTKIPISNQISEIAIPGLEISRFKFEYNRCMNDLLLLQLALHAYKLEHNKYPTKLSDLAAGYLKSIPLDPFSRGGVYKYRLTSDGYTLYSLGPDLKDDGGKAATRAGYSAIRFVDYESKGDIVAGYNR